jgi:hypothetical protein
MGISGKAIEEYKRIFEKQYSYKISAKKHSKAPQTYSYLLKHSLRLNTVTDGLTRKNQARCLVLESTTRIL